MILGLGRALFGFAAALWLASSVARAQEVILKLHHFVPPTAIAHVKLLAPWADKIAQEANGRIKIQIYPALLKNARGLIERFDPS